VQQRTGFLTVPRHGRRTHDDLSICIQPPYVYVLQPPSWHGTSLVNFHQSSPGLNNGAFVPPVWRIQVAAPILYTPAEQIFGSKIWMLGLIGRVDLRCSCSCKYGFPLLPGRDASGKRNVIIAYFCDGATATTWIWGEYRQELQLRISDDIVHLV
jgi:hypothetical protein